MNSRLIIALGLTTLLSLSGWSAPVAAQGAISPSLSVNPGIVKETLKPGETKQVKIRLENLGTDPIPLSSSMLNIAKVSELGAPELTASPTPQSASQWISAEKPDLILPGSKSEELIINIVAPAKTAPGGYSAAMIFQAKLPSYYFDIDANARILPALSVSFLITIATDSVPSIDSLKIDLFQAPKVVISAPVPLVTEINNPTNFFIYANGDITVKPTFGRDSQVTELKSSVMMPTASRKYISAYTGSIWPGLYEAQIKLNDGTKTLVASAKFVVIPWQFLLTIFLFIVLIISLRGRRRLRKALAILAGKEPSPPRRRPTLR